MAVDIGISESHRGRIVDILNRLLADEFVLYVKTRSFHWNVQGPNFSELHKFFESQYESLDEVIDEVAERSRALGGTAAGSLKEFSGLATLPEGLVDFRKPAALLGALLADHEQVIRGLRKDVGLVNDELGDVGTGDFLTGLLEQHEKMAWMLRALVAR